MKLKPVFNFALSLYGVLMLSTSAGGDCCRKPQARVYYGALGSHRAYKDDSTLERVEVVRGRPSLTVSVYRPAEAYFRDQSAYLESADLGRTWEEVLYPWGLPSNLPGKGGYVIQAPSDPKIVYKWLQDVGLYLRSENRGNTWRLPEYSVDGVSKEDFAFRVSGERSYRLGFRLAAVHPSQPMTLYAGIEAVPWAGRIYDEDQPRERRAPGIYVSYDGGETWTKFSDDLQNFTPSPNYDVSPLGIAPSNPQVMYAVGRGGIVSSNDGGNHWALVNEEAELQRAPGRLVDGRKVEAVPTDPGGIRVTQFAFDPTNEKIVYVVSSKGVYRTEDGGGSWCLLNLGFDVLDACNSIGVNPSNPKEIFIGTTFGFFYSSDRGCKFRRIYPRQSNLQRKSTAAGQ